MPLKLYPLFDHVPLAKTKGNVYKKYEETSKEQLEVAIVHPIHFIIKTEKYKLEICLNLLIDDS